MNIIIILEDKDKESVKEKDEKIILQEKYNNQLQETIKNIESKWNSINSTIQNKFQKKRLTKEEERKLLESIRFSHLSHSDLISLSIDPIMGENKDLILLGLSFRLNAYESVNKSENTDNKINYNSRKYLKDQNIYLGNFSNKSKQIYLYCILYIIIH
jgi:hypothetical protein